MNRKNFGSVSGVIVDVCKQHGTWFDLGELPRVLAFVAGGGMDRTRARVAAEAADAHRASVAAAAAVQVPTSSHDHDALRVGTTLTELLVNLLLR
jgi:hypothetical protein